MDSMVKKALAFGFSHAAGLDVSTLVLREEVRDMCSADKCRMYGRCWTCPPACGSLAENAEVLRGYASGLLVQTTAVLEDDFDYESMEKAGALQQERFRSLFRELKKESPGTMGLGSGGCRLCDVCTYPDAPCRNPDMATTSMEAYGLWVSDVCTRNGMAYNYGPQTITYTGCYLFPAKKKEETP